MKRKIYILFVVLFATPLFRLGTGGSIFAQRDSIHKAAELVSNEAVPKQERVKKALEIVDRAILHPECAKDGYSWYVRGYIYKDWYLTFEMQNKKSQTRQDAVNHLKKALSLLEKDTTAMAAEYKKYIRLTIKFLGSRFQNDAAELLESGDTSNFKTAIENFEQFKECMLIAEPDYQIKSWEINFKNVLGDKYTDAFRADIKNNIRFFGKAEAAYREVLVLDTNNWSANYNTAMLYYNYGVDIINSMDIEATLIEVDKIQEEAKEMFKKALPFALKAYSLNPKDRRVLICLQGIYFSLYEFEKSDEFKALLDALDKEK